MLCNPSSPHGRRNCCDTPPPNHLSPLLLLHRTEWAIMVRLEVAENQTRILHTMTISNCTTFKMGFRPTQEHESISSIVPTSTLVSSSNLHTLKHTPRSNQLTTQILIIKSNTWCKTSNTLHSIILTNQNSSKLLTSRTRKHRHPVTSNIIQTRTKNKINSHKKIDKN